MIARTSLPLAAPHSSQPALGTRVLPMLTVWAALGAIMGATAGMQGGGIIGAIAGMMTGIVELALLGSVFAVIGGRPNETIVGAVGGLIIGLAVALTGGQTPIVFVANLGMVIGAMAGATLRAYVRLLCLPFVLAGRLHRFVIDVRRS